MREREDLCCVHHWISRTTEAAKVFKTLNTRLRMKVSGTLALRAQSTRFDPQHLIKPGLRRGGICSSFSYLRFLCSRELKPLKGWSGAGFGVAGL